MTRAKIYNLMLKLNSTHYEHFYGANDKFKFTDSINMGGLYGWTTIYKDFDAI